MSDLHPDFLAAMDRVRWTGALDELWTLLRVEAWQRRGQWAHRILPRGALVAVRVVAQGPHAMRRELRIARRGVGTTEGWTRECHTFLTAFHCSGWFVEPVTPPDGVQESRWIERYPGETEAGSSKCDRCGQPVPMSTLWAAARCDSCARQAGAEEIAANRQAR